MDATPIESPCTLGNAKEGRPADCVREHWKEKGAYRVVAAAEGAAAQIARCRRRIYFDLGVNSFTSSMGWFLTKYPVQFDEVAGWEMSSRFPHAPRAADFNKRVPNRRFPRVLNIYNSVAGVKRVNCDCKASDRGCATRHQRATAYADPISKESATLGKRHGGCTSMSLSDYIKERVRPEDFFVVKMDVDGFEYIIMDQLRASGAAQLIDEIFIEFHFSSKSPGLTGWDRPGGPAWRSYPDRGRAMQRADAEKYIAEWREFLPATHIWG